MVYHALVVARPPEHAAATVRGRGAVLRSGPERQMVRAGGRTRPDANGRVPAAERHATGVVRPAVHRQPERHRFHVQRRDAHRRLGVVGHPGRHAQPQGPDRDQRDGDGHRRRHRSARRSDVGNAGAPGAQRTAGDPPEHRRGAGP